MPQEPLGCFRCEAIRLEQEPMFVVYQAINAINGKRYIGMTTKGLPRRRRGHLSQSKSDRRPLPYFGRAIRKYGLENFHFSILEVCDDRDHAYEREKHLVEFLRPEYNTAEGGRGSRGFTHSEETKRKWSESRRGHIGYWAGKKREPESVSKMLATRKAKGIKSVPPPWTPERLEKSLSRLRAQAVSQRKRVKCLSDGNEFAGAEEAAKFYGISVTPIRRCCLGVRKPECGLIFEYVIAQESLAA